jgi:hypothetical protein
MAIPSACPDPSSTTAPADERDVQHEERGHDGDADPGSHPSILGRRAVATGAGARLGGPPHDATAADAAGQRTTAATAVRKRRAGCSEHDELHHRLGPRGRRTREGVR